MFPNGRQERVRRRSEQSEKYLPAGCTPRRRFLSEHGKRELYFRQEFATKAPGDFVTARWYKWKDGGNLVCDVAQIVEVRRNGVVFEPMPFVYSTKYLFSALFDGALKTRFGLEPEPFVLSGGMFTTLRNTSIRYREMRYPDENILEPDVW